MDALKKGLVNLEAHVENMRKYGVPVVVAINRFLTDTDQEIKVLAECCQRLGVEYSLSEVFAKGGDGAIDLAQKVVKACAQPSAFRSAWPKPNILYPTTRLSLAVLPDLPLMYGI